MTILAENTSFFKHKIISHLGSGAFGDVYLAKNVISNHQQALKVIQTDLSTNINSQVSEIQNLAKCNCDYVVQLNEADIVAYEGKEYIAFALEFLEQGSLENKAKNSQINFREIFTSIRHVLHALNVAHGHGVIHKDIKPANIMVATPYYKLGDFGLSFLKSNGALESNLNYFLHAAPECLQGGAADERSDIYAVGMTFFRLVIPSAFFDLDDESIEKWAAGSMKKNLPSYLKYPGYLPVRIKKIINKATAVLPEQRYQTAMEMLRDLEKLQIQIAWKQSADGRIWEGYCNNHKHHVASIIDKKGRFSCIYKVNGRKPREWDDVGPTTDYDSVIEALSKLVSSTILI